MSTPFSDIRVQQDGGVTTITINRPDHGNMIRRQTALELCGALRTLRDDPQQRVAILTGAGERFFCIGGEHEQHEPSGASVPLPMVDLYELLDTVPKPVIAAVNGFAVGGGNVLHVMCDLSIAADGAVFRQVGPIVGSFDAGYGTWYLEDAIGRKRAKEMWYLNRRYSATQALALGLVNEVVAAEALMVRAGELAAELLDRGPGALAGLKAAFAARHHGVLGQARIAHDLLLTSYLETPEATELAASFRERRVPDREQFRA